MLSRYRRSGNTVKENAKAQTRQNITKPHLKRLLSVDTQTAQINDTVRQRCNWIREEFGVKLSPPVLARIYKENKIGYLTPNYHFYLRGSRENQLEKQ